MSNLADGNTAALRLYEARQDRLELGRPTPSERDNYIENWLDKKCKQMGDKFLTEAFCESDSYARIYIAYVEGDTVEVGMAFDKLVRNYWLPMAERDCDQHDFSLDREA